MPRRGDGFRSAAEAARESGLQELFKGYSERYGRYATELQSALHALGYEAALPAGLAGVVYAGWMKLVALMSGHDQHSILAEAVRGGEWIRKTYREALDKNLPVGIRTMLEVHYAEVEKDCAYLRERSEATAVPNRP